MKKGIYDFVMAKKNLITFTLKSKEQKLICTCPLLQVIIYALMQRSTNQNSNSFFNLFLQSFKNKIITSLFLYFPNIFSDYLMVRIKSS